jgi:hypothetical protein
LVFLRVDFHKEELIIKNDDVHSTSVIRVSSYKGQLVKILAKIEVSSNTWLVKLSRISVNCFESLQKLASTAKNDICVWISSVECTTVLVDLLFLESIKSMCTV